MTVTATNVGNTTAAYLYSFDQSIMEFGVDWDTSSLQHTNVWVRAIANDGMYDSSPAVARIYDFSSMAGQKSLCDENGK